MRWQLEEDIGGQVGGFVFYFDGQYNVPMKMIQQKAYSASHYTNSVQVLAH